MGSTLGNIKGAMTPVAAGKDPTTEQRIGKGVLGGLTGAGSQMQQQPQQGGVSIAPNTPAPTYDFSQIGQSLQKKKDPNQAFYGGY